MTAATTDLKIDQLGTGVLPELLKYPVAASTTIYGGTLVAIDASGNAVPASTTGTLKVVGRCERKVANVANGAATPDGIPDGTAGSVSVQVRQGCFYLNYNTDGGALSKANFGANVYASDDNTVSLSDAGGTRPYAGYLLDAGGQMLSTTTKVAVMVGVANPYALNPELSTGAASRARAVMTSLAAYTGSGTATLTASANGALAAQDGVTIAVGDVVFIQGGTTNLTAAKDSGPWLVTSVGGASAKWTFIRPDFFAHGSTMQLAATMEIGGESTIWAGTSWRSFAAKGAVVGTDDPAFYVGRMTQSVTLASSTATLSNVGIRSASKTAIICAFQTAGGTVTSTVGYGVIAAPTPGYIGTASAVIDALASGMTKNGTADASTILVTVINF